MRKEKEYVLIILASIIAIITLLYLNSFGGVLGTDATSSYPTTLDTRAVQTSTHVITSAGYNGLTSAIVALETKLGIGQLTFEINIDSKAVPSSGYRIGIDSYSIVFISTCGISWSKIGSQ